MTFYIVFVCIPKLFLSFNIKNFCFQVIGEDLGVVKKVSELLFHKCLIWYNDFPWGLWEAHIIIQCLRWQEYSDNINYFCFLYIIYTVS